MAIIISVSTSLQIRKRILKAGISLSTPRLVSAQAHMHLTQQQAGIIAAAAQVFCNDMAAIHRERMGLLQQAQQVRSPIIVCTSAPAGSCMLQTCCLATGAWLLRELC